MPAGNLHLLRTIAIAAVGMLALVIGALAENQLWVSLAPLPEPMVDIQGATANGKFYVFGGLDGVKSKGAVLEFDPATGGWIKKKPMPSPAHHLAVTSYGDRIYMFGGFKYPDKGSGWQPLDNAWEYDPASDSWKALKAMPTKRGGAAAAALNGKFYIIGGAAPAKGGTPETIEPKRRHDILAQVEEYDLKADSWRARAPLPTPRAEPVAATVTGKIYVIGGRLGSLFASGSDTDIVEAYDPAQESWSAPLERMPTPRAPSGLAIWRNLIVVAGDDTKESRASAAIQAIEAYDSGANKWKTLPAIAQARRGFAAGAVGDRFYIAGGEMLPASAGQKPELTLLQALQLDAMK